MTEINNSICFVLPNITMSMCSRSSGTVQINIMSKAQSAADAGAAIPVLKPSSAARRTQIYTNTNTNYNCLYVKDSIVNKLLHLKELCLQFNK